MRLLAKGGFLLVQQEVSKQVLGCSGTFNSVIANQVKNLIWELTHWKLTLKLIESSSWGHSVTSQWTHKMTHAVSLLWAFCEVCNSHSELTATTARWAHQVISQIAHSKLTLWVANSWKAHSKLTVWIILWVHSEVTECPKNELYMSFSVSSQWISCELKFFRIRQVH